MALQAVQLLYTVLPDFDAEAIAARTAEITGEPTTGISGDATQIINHDAFVVEYTDTTAPAQTVLLQASTRPKLADYETALAYTRDWPDARDVIGRAKACVMLTEMMARGLHPPLRIEAFHAALQAVVELYPPLAMAIRHADLIVDPAAWLASCDERPPIARPGSLNVRFIGTPTGYLMDTRGLEDIGLHDLQCHYQDIEPDTIASFLYNVAYYIFDNGPVIENGNTLESPIGDGKWRCQFEQALAGPERDVLDICPNAPHAGGNR
jgi:hypothetical protein